MTEPLDVEYVELRSRGTQRTAADVARAMDEIARDVEHTAREMEHELDSSLRDVARHFQLLGEAAVHEARRAGRDWEETGIKIAAAVSAGAQVAQAEVDDAADHMVRDAHRVARANEETASSFLQVAAAAVAAKTSQALGGLSGGLVEAGGLVGGNPLVAGLVAFSPAILAVAGSLYQLIGLLNVVPAGFATLVAAVVPAIVAMHGFGGALAAIASGNPKKIQKELAKLAPSARAVAREVEGLIGPLHRLQQATQQAFFLPLVGVLRRAGATLVDYLGIQLPATARVLGSTVAGIIQQLSTTRNMTVISHVFDSVIRMITAAGPTILRFIDALFAAIDAGLPFIERLNGGFLRMIDSLSAFIQRSIQAGSFQRFIEGALTTLKDLGALGAAVFRLLGALLGHTADQGHSFLQSLTAALNRFGDFLASKTGQQAIQDFLKLLPVLEFFIENAFGALMAMTHQFVGVIGTLTALWHWLVNAGKAVADFFTTAGDKAGGAFDAVVNWITNAFHAVVGFFTRLPGQVWDALRALPQVLADAITAGFDLFFQAIGAGIGFAVRMFMELPGRVWAIIQNLWDVAVSLTARGIAFVITQWDALPGRIGAAVSALWNWVVGQFHQGVNNVSFAINELPGRAWDAVGRLGVTLKNAISGALSWLYDAGRNVVQGLINGIASMVADAINIGKRMVNDIIKGIKDGFKFGSPSKVMRDIGVGVVQSYVLGVDDESVRAARRTLGALAPPTAAALAPDTGAAPQPAGGVTFNEGAIAVHFTGVVPTEDEARRTGRMLGQAVLDAVLGRSVMPGNARTV